ncbi:MAG: transcription elongation factor GreA [Solirubrobacteraceae bacterium]
MDSITMTAEELATVKEELRRLEGAARSEVASRIKTAREWGDLKENAEYHAAKEEQAHLETRILKLRDQVRRADVIQTAPEAAEVVEHGSTVSYTDTATNKTRTYKIVSPYDAKPGEGKLSAASPIAKALLGKRIGEVVRVHTPAGIRALSVESIS